VDATSALGVLGYRGFDPDHLIRRGLAENVKLGLASWLGRAVHNTDDPRRAWKHFDPWRRFFEKAIGDDAPLEDYISTALNGSTAQNLDSWIATASIDDILLLTPPGEITNVIPQGPPDEVAEIWGWIVERFTQTYLNHWSLTSLKQEYSFVRGSWNPQFSTELLADRVIAREDITAALADRTLLADDADDAVEPSIMTSFTDQALALLADGQRNAAAAIFNAARTLKPNDTIAQNNYAFCTLIDRPREARDLLTDVLSRSAQPDAVTLCNIAVAESLLGNSESSLNACAQAYEKAEDNHTVFLWTLSDDEWVVEETKVRPWLIRFGAQLEESSGTNDRLWRGRRDSLRLLGAEETS
jgi:tetratricopeptide (TPR) repeat protein